MGRVLAMATHYPRPERREDLLAAMERVDEAAQGVAGLESIGAYAHPDGARVVAVSIWASEAAMQAGMQQIFGTVGPLPFDEWEEQAHELVFLPHVVGGVRTIA